MTTPANPDDEEEIEIHLHMKDMINHVVMFDLDWLPGEDINQWVVPGHLELVIVNPVGALQVNSY